MVVSYYFTQEQALAELYADLPERPPNTTRFYCEMRDGLNYLTGNTQTSVRFYENPANRQSYRNPEEFDQMLEGGDRREYTLPKSPKVTGWISIERAVITTILSRILDYKDAAAETSPT